MGRCFTQIKEKLNEYEFAADVSKDWGKNISVDQGVVKAKDTVEARNKAFKIMREKHPEKEIYIWEITEEDKLN
jgi:hypothetical protein